MPREDLLKILEAFRVAYNDVDIPALETLVSEDLHWEHHNRFKGHGRAGFVQSVRDFAEKTPGRHFAEPARFAINDQTVYIEHTWHAVPAHPTSPGVMMSVDAEGFTIEPLALENRCTPESVSAHMLYENSDPFNLVEPGGVLDVTDADYRALDERRVRVTGSKWTPGRYTMKLEGAGGGPFQTIMLVGIEDPAVMADVDGFVGRMAYALRQRVRRTLGAEASAIEISLRPYGWNAVSGRVPPPDARPPREIGLLFVATAPSQALANEAAKVCNPYFFHFPVREGKELPSYAFPFSPAEIERGQVFEFQLNHIVETASPFELVRTRIVEATAPSGAPVRA